MAPEVQSMRYDQTVDIYSLGLVLYKLMNNNRLPFLNPSSQMINPQEYHDALDRRLSGEKLPDPVSASPALANVIRKACEYDPKNRYLNATAFKNALTSIQKSKTTIRISSSDPLLSSLPTPEMYTPNITNERMHRERPPIWVGGPPPSAPKGPGYVKKKVPVNPKVEKKKKSANTVAIVIVILVLIACGVAAMNQTIHTSMQEPAPVAAAQNE